MKIPESVRIAGVEYVVDHVDDLNDGQRILMGQIDYIAHKININSKLDMDPQSEALTLLHEIFHGIRQANRSEALPNEEEVVEMFAQGIYQVLQDNGKRLFDLAEE